MSQAYAATGAVPQAEIESALPMLLRFRWVLCDPKKENKRGLEDARKALGG